jgi:hypothetical protein
MMDRHGLTVRWCPWTRKNKRTPTNSSLKAHRNKFLRHVIAQSIKSNLTNTNVAHIVVSRLLNVSRARTRRRLFQKQKQNTNTHVLVRLHDALDAGQG